MVRLDPFLLALADKVACVNSSFEATTSDFGKLFGVSQQSASRYLMLLEEKGWITRTRSGSGFTVSITDEGADVLKKLENTITSFLQSDVKKEFHGEIVSGIGEGAYYVSKYAEKINTLIGYTPFHGTFNVRVYGGKPELRTSSTLDIEGFTSEDRSYGNVGLTPVALYLRDIEINCYAIQPERTHHKRDLELISNHNLRKKFKAIDGDEVRFILL